MKVLDKSSDGVILKVSEKDIFLIRRALKEHSDGTGNVFTVKDCSELTDILDTVMEESK